MTEPATTPSATVDGEALVAGQGASYGIRDARRLVVKVGSSSLTTSTGVLDVVRLTELVDQLAVRVLDGVQVVLVSSGAVAAGILPLGLTKRPRDLATQQAAASVGQGALVAAYTKAFGAHGLTVGQVLLTADDLIRQQHYANARRAVNMLLRLGVVPVVNENDTVATHDVRFGDNDRLAALLAHLVHAEGLLLLTDVDALYDGPPREPGSSRLPLVRSSRDLEYVRLGDTGSKIGTGGMVTKVEAARIATGAGITTMLTSTELADQALAGEDVGTVFTPTAPRPSSRMLWLAHASAPRGRLIIDDGAVRALVTKHASLLPAGIVRVEGGFDEGSPVEVVDRTGRAVARGLVAYSSENLPRLLGRSTHWLGEVFGPDYSREVIHRDYLVLV